MRGIPVSAVLRTENGVLEAEVDVHDDMAEGFKQDPAPDLKGKVFEEGAVFRRGCGRCDQRFVGG